MVRKQVRLDRCRWLHNLELHIDGRRVLVDDDVTRRPMLAILLVDEEGSRACGEN